MQSADKQPNEGKQPKKNSLEEKIHRHLNDQNDRITDEDISNVVVGSSSDISADGTTVSEKAEQMEKEIPKGKKGSPWDTLTDE